MRNCEAKSEERAALSCCELGSALQDLLYYREGVDVSARSGIILRKAYRQIKEAVDVFFDPCESPLYYTAPLFEKRNKGARAE